MRLHLRYWVPYDIPFHGGTYSDWAQLLAMIPAELLDRRWQVQEILGDVYLYVWLREA